MNYSKLYIDILKIGVNKLNTGLSYVVLKEELEKKGYNFNNDCIELAVKQWFFDCFHHRTSVDEIEDLHDIDDHLKCNWVLKGDSCLTLVEHKTSIRNLRIAIIAIVISTISLLLQLKPELNITKKQEKLKFKQHDTHIPKHPSRDTLK
jgi:hypothetical protein